MKIAPHIDRFGDIRKMLVDYFQYVFLKRDNVLKEAFFKAAREEYGDPWSQSRFPKGISPRRCISQKDY